MIADVIGPKQSAAADALALLCFAAANGFLIAAFFGLVRTFFSRYRKLRAGRACALRGGEMLDLHHRAAGFFPKRLLRRASRHNQLRMAFEAIKAA